MFFTVSKILGFFANPSNLVIAIGLLGLSLLITRWARAGIFLVAGSFAMITILGLSPIGNALLIPLEQRFPPWDASRGAPAGIIVLGGVISPDVSAARDEVALNEFCGAVDRHRRACSSLSGCAHFVLRRQRRAGLR